MNTSERETARTETGEHTVRWGLALAAGLTAGVLMHVWMVWLFGWSPVVKIAGASGSQVFGWVLHLLISAGYTLAFAYSLKLLGWNKWLTALAWGVVTTVIAALAMPPMLQTMKQTMQAQARRATAVRAEIDQLPEPQHKPVSTLLGIEAAHAQQGEEQDEGQQGGGAPLSGLPRPAAVLINHLLFFLVVALLYRSGELNTENIGTPEEI